MARVHVLVRAEGTLQDALFESVRAPAQDGPDGEEETQEPEEDDHGPEVLALRQARVALRVDHVHESGRKEKESVQFNEPAPSEAIDLGPPFNVSSEK